MGFKTYFVLKTSPHTVHGIACPASGWYASLCLLKLCAVLKLLLHSPHTNLLTPVWTPLCCSKSRDLVKAASHLSHWNRIRYVICGFMGKLYFSIKILFIVLVATEPNNPFASLWNYLFYSSINSERSLLCTNGINRKQNIILFTWPDAHFILINILAKLN